MLDEGLHFFFGGFLKLSRFRESSVKRVYFSPGILIVPVGFSWNTIARPPTRTALVMDSSLTVWSSRIGGNIPRKSSDFAKSKGGVGLSDPSSEYNSISDSPPKPV